MAIHRDGSEASYRQSVMGPFDCLVFFRSCAGEPFKCSISGNSSELMPASRISVAWATLFGVIVAAEALVRFAIPFNLMRVLVVEALLFFAAAIVIIILIQRPPLALGWCRGLQWILVWFFILGGIRAAIWALGQPVMRANMAVLLFGIVVLIGNRIWRRRHREKPPAAT